MSHPLTPEEHRLATLIVNVLNLEDVDPDEVDPEAVMFEENGLGLDSIDALEIAVAVAEEYGVHLSEEDEETRSAFATLRSLTNHIHAQAAAG